jgi:rod shape-determining protein MreD
MPLVRPVVAVLLLMAAVVLQLSFFGHFSLQGVVPNLVLLVVVSAGLTRGPELAALLGFTGGMLLDLVPPADHVAGRWALALTLVGFLAGHVRRDAGRSTLLALATVAGASLLGTTVFALSGMLLRDPAVPVTEALQIIPLSLVYDLLLAPFVLPPTMRLFRRLRPHEVAF